MTSQNKESKNPPPLSTPPKDSSSTPNAIISYIRLSLSKSAAYPYQCFLTFTLYFAVVLLWVQLFGYQSSLGISIQETGVISIASAIAFIASPVLSGSLGDYLTSYKKVYLFLVCTCCSLFAFAFSWVRRFSLDTPIDVMQPSTISPNFTEQASVSANEMSSSVVSQHFLPYIVVHVVYMFLNAAVISLSESFILVSLEEKNDYFYIKAYGSAAAAISAPLAGFIVDFMTDEDGNKDFSVIFYLSTAFQLLSALIIITKMKLKTKENSETDFIIKDCVACSLVKKVAPIFTLVTVAGCFVNVIETFMYRFAGDLGASSTLLGLTVPVGGVTEFFSLQLIPLISRYLDILSMFALSFVMFGVRYVGYFLIYNPWYILICEVLDSFCGPLIFNLSVILVCSLVPEKNFAFYRGLLGTFYMGLGKLLGSLVGTGFFFSELGQDRDLWLYSFIAAFSVAALLSLLRVFVPNCITQCPEDGATSAVEDVEKGGGNNNEAFVVDEEVDRL